MTVESLLTSVAEKGVELWLEGNRLRFRAPDGALTPELREQLAGRRADVIDVLRRRRRETVRLESPAHGQSALWFINQTAPDSSAYNIAFAARILSPVDKPGLREALQTLVDRHGSLRTTFASDLGNLVRRIPGYVDVALTEHDVSDLSAEDVDQAVEREYRKPFDLSQGPLFRSALFSKGESDHVLLLAVHHIICDGWSLIILVDELRSILKQQNGELSPLDELRADYDAFVEWQRHFLASTEGRKQRDYWMSQLAGDLPLLDLAPDGPRPMAEESHGRSISFQISPEVTGAINRVARDHSTTNYVVLLAAYQILLSRYSGQDEVLVGSPAFGRSRPEFGRVVGDFINMVTLRGRVAGDRPFTEYLPVTRDAVLEALDNQDYPFSKIVEALGGRLHRTHSPIFQATFTYQGFEQLREIQDLMMTNGRQTPVSFGALDLMPYVLVQQEGQFDYSLEMTEKDGRLRGSLRFRTALMSAASAKRMVEAYVHLLAEITRRPAALIDEIGMLSADGRREVLELSQSKVPSDTGDASAISRFVGQCRERPAALAVRYGEVKLSYAELDRRSTDLARYLVSQGLPNDALVGLYLQRSEKLLVAVLGVMKAGAAYLPLDPAFPAERLGYMLEDSGACLVLTESALAGSLPDKGARSVCLDGGEMAEAAGTKALPDVDPASRAYVIYTSGSTGKPKGVEVTHRNVANFLASMAREPGLTASDVLCAVTTLSFDISVLELLLPLSVGATVVLADRETASDGRRLGSLLTSRDVTAMQATPATWRMLIESGWQGDRQLKVLCGGEALPGDLAAALLERAGEVWNMYGPTETTIWSSCGRVTDPAAVHIGRPIANTAIYVVDARGELQPVGVPGEIWIGGDGVARGYLHRPALTAERFLPDPCTPGERVYRTGDQGRWRSDGTLQHLGRIDNQVKVRGFRIEPGEIETRLAELPQVEQAVVSVWQPSQGDQRLVAYYLGDAVLTAAELRTHLQQTLPDYMIPQFFVRLDALPLTPNGKIDRKALPAPLGDETATAAYAPPRTDTEAQLAAIWQQLLSVDAIGRDDNFFERGGHSLLAARVVAHVNSRFQVELPLRTLFEAPTPARLAVHLVRLTQGGDQAAYRPIERRDPSRPASLSFAQEQLWYLHQLAPDNTAYNLAGALELRGRLDERALKVTLETIVNRHESLRTSFVMADGWPVQRIAGPCGFALETVELQPSIDGGELRDLLEQEIRRPFDLHSGPLFRTVLYKLAPEHSVVLVICHHIIMDGWSLGVFVRELGQVYARIAAGEEANLPSLPIQYADYAAWQRDALAGERIESLLAYWRTTLAGSPPHLEVPTDRLRPPQFSHRGAHHAFTLPVALRDGLQALARREGATLFMTLLASFQLLLSRYSNQRDILVGSPVANRVRPELEGLIGDFVNTLVLRTELSDGMTFRELLGAVRSTCLGAYAHQQLPFEKLVEALRPGHDLSRNPVFQVMFALQNMALPSLTLGDLDIVPFRLERNGAQMDLTLYMWETPEGLQATFEYATDLFDAETIERMAGHLRNLLQAAADRPDTNILRLPLLDDNERQELLTRGNRVPDQGNDTVLSLLAKQTARTPQRIAADYEGATLTFAELDARSNRLAHHLRSLGVGTDTLVGLCVPRSLDMLVGMVAILKAGGAWLPLDPDFPTERLRFMLEDSGATVLVSLATVAQEAINDLPLSRVNLDTDGALIEACSSEAPGAAVHGDQLAYVIYTSGSTGRPKGVEIEHRALANFLRSMAREPGVSESDVLVAVTTLSFDISILELLLPLVTGARVVIASRDAVLDGQRLAAELRRAGATLLQATPATWRLLIESGWTGDGRLKALCGGEALPADLAATLLERVGELWNLYGPTETTIWSTCTRITDAQSVHIGTPVANTEVFILNEALEPQPVGVPGHLYIGGHGVARGYHNRPDLVAERFLAHPFGGRGRIYATGDRARWRRDGAIEHLGRLDNQVKLRGYRIELGEIESCLAEHPDVKQCAVALRESRPGDQRLVACYVAESGRQTTVTSLRSHVKSLLPSYMIPQHFIEMDTLPLTPNGKIDRNALPAPGGTPSAEDRYVPPAGEGEKRLAALWQEMLGTDRIGVNDNFFDLGGHSLLAARLVNRLQEQFGVRVTLQALTADTLGQIASSIAITPADELHSSAEGSQRRPGNSPAGFIRRLLRRQSSGQQ